MGQDHEPKMFDSRDEAYRFFNDGTDGCDEIEECERCGRFSLSQDDDAVHGGIVGPHVDEIEGEKVYDRVCAECDELLSTLNINNVPRSGENVAEADRRVNG